MIVLDCSAAIRIVRQAPEADLFEAAVGQNEKIISSTLFYAEIASSFRKYITAHILTPKTATMAAFTAAELVDEFHDMQENYLEALTEGTRLDHSPYDMFYFTLARRYGATLLTADTALARLCKQEGMAYICPGA